MRRVLVIGFWVVSTLTVARAADQLILGRTLVVRNGGTSAQRSIIVKARESSSDDTLVGDPVADGATLTITLNGAVPSAGTYALPTGTSATTRRPFWSGDAAGGFEYGDSSGENGPVKRVQLKLQGGVFRLKVKVDGRLGPVDLVPPDPGSDGCALLTIVGGDSYSVQFASGEVKNDGAALFKVARPASEGSCATVTTTITTSTTTTTIPLSLVPRPGPRRFATATSCSARSAPPVT